MGKNDCISAFRSFLERACATKKCVGLSTLPLSGFFHPFMVGRVLSVSSSHYLLALVDPDGQEDGLRAGRLSRICQIWSGSSSISCYEKAAGATPADWASLFRKSFSVGDTSLYLDVLRFAMKEKLAVTLDLNWAGFPDEQGIVRDIQGDYVIMSRIDLNDRGLDGVTTVKLQSIVGIQCLTKEERVCQLINASRMARAEDGPLGRRPLRKRRV